MVAAVRDLQSNETALATVPVPVDVTVTSVNWLLLNGVAVHAAATGDVPTVTVTALLVIEGRVFPFTTVQHDPPEHGPPVFKEALLNGS